MEYKKLNDKPTYIEVIDGKPTRIFLVEALEGENFDDLLFRFYPKQKISTNGALDLTLQLNSDKLYKKSLNKQDIVKIPYIDDLELKNTRTRLW